MYNIKIQYQTGDSFSTAEREETIEMEWVHLDRAKESLKRIQNHYEFYQKHDNIWEKPEGVELPEGVLWDDENKMICLELIADNGDPFRYGCFWVGYFESLRSATIVRSFKDIKYEP